MSFQDIGRKGPPSSFSSSSSSSSSRPQQSPISPTAKFRNNGGPSSVSSSSTSAAAASSGGTAIVQPMSMGMDGDHEYSAISQAILQYQQNVGILSNIIQSIGSSNTAQDTQVLTQQYNLQTDVIQQLSSKIQLQLEQMNMNHGHNNSHSHNHGTNHGTKHGTIQQHRATHLKLTRDYKWVETKYKNVQLDARRRWNMVQMEKKRIVEEEQRKTLENDLDHDNQQLQMQLRDDRIVEEIMREREEEVRNINKGMHQVNEIYKDLANIVSFQQDQVDEVETTMEEANKNAESGLKQIEKAHAKSEEGNCVIS